MSFATLVLAAIDGVTFTADSYTTAQVHIQNYNKVYEKNMAVYFSVTITLRNLYAILILQC